MRSTTTSIRISTDLATRLRETAIQQKRGKNSLITQAVEEYLGRIDQNQFLEEARRQSALASTGQTEDEEIWLQHVDASGWK